MDPAELTTAIKSEARRLGFDLVGACPAVTPSDASRFSQWLSSGYAGQMAYLLDRKDAYAHPQSLLDSVRSVLVLAINYRTLEPAEPRPGQGRVSRYAWGDDYHDVIRQKLHQLADFVRQSAPKAAVRGVVDTAPIFERQFAQMAGLGWIGKNTLLLNRQLGSWMFLAALLTDLELEYDPPHETDHCGSCRLCLDACPTDAFVDAYVLDARKCISYLTIELREAVDVELRSGVGDWLFGCDICQDVCPWNHHAPVATEPAFEPGSGMNPIELAELFDMDDVAFRKKFHSSPLARPKRRGLLRNAAIVLGNHPHLEAAKALIRGLNDAEPLVRGACAWALGRYDTEESLDALQMRMKVESDESVRGEILDAIENYGDE